MYLTWCPQHTCAQKCRSDCWRRREYRTVSGPHRRQQGERTWRTAAQPRYGRAATTEGAAASRQGWPGKAAARTGLILGTTVNSGRQPATETPSFGLGRPVVDFRFGRTYWNRLVVFPDTRWVLSFFFDTLHLGTWGCPNPGSGLPPAAISQARAVLVHTLLFISPSKSNSRCPCWVFRPLWRIHNLKEGGEYPPKQ